ncbi:Riboflavin biosynthesis protein RibF [Roseivivax jejudonensis]|uniref:FAD synthase n=1 Tax=Roseivivax jejudonensis TaxID=1529041 RepID=A0A1X7A603_9RHOB|nr:adenylyltransferase/cytidyltransferase family protein [Roseivivax jejudonensis]SLN71476.1 Riboflavin biosynthesis protein RibF [Roseivivax jejudonensis]
MTVLDDARPVPRHLRGGVLLLGNFDGLHLGHRSLIAAARRLAGDRPVGVMACEPHPRQYFAPEEPGFRLHCPRSKLMAFSSAGLDYVYQPVFDARFAAQTPAEFANAILRQRLGVSGVVLGSDFRFGARRAGDADWLKNWGSVYGVDVEVVRNVSSLGSRVSSTSIRAQVARGDVRCASKLLGASWMVETIVLEKVTNGCLRLQWPADVIQLPEDTYAVRCGSASGNLVVGKTAVFLKLPNEPAHTAGSSLTLCFGHW